MILWAGWVSRKWTGFGLAALEEVERGETEASTSQGCFLIGVGMRKLSHLTLFLVSLILEGALYPSPCGRRLVPKGMFQSSPCTLQPELAGLGSGPWRPASDLLRPSCLEFHGPLVPLTLYTSLSFFSSLLSTFCSLLCHGLLPWCLLLFSGCRLGSD